MFTGIIECMATVVAMEWEQSNLHISLKAEIANQLKIDQSLAHNGVCLTVVKIEDDIYTVTAIKETLEKTTIGLLKIGQKVNLERCMQSNGRFDGHIVQGHVDETGKCENIRNENGSWIYTFSYQSSYGNVTVEKGSICVNGVSLTVFNSQENSFSVAIIPYTYQHTTFQYLKAGDKVNLEFDIIGKYVKRLMNK